MRKQEMHYVKREKRSRLQRLHLQADFVPLSYLTLTPPGTLCFLREASLAVASSTGCCPGAELRGFTQRRNAGGIPGPPGPAPQLWATTTRCPPRRGLSEPQLILKITPRLSGLTEFEEGLWNRSNCSAAGLI